MKISIIIPAFQCKHSLRDTVECIINTKQAIAEILLIDDGSSDGTSELCEQLEKQYELIRCIHKKNGGVSSARNLGIELVSGDYIWFVDSDDMICTIPNEVLLDCTRNDPGMVMFGMKFEYFRDNRLIKTEIHQVQERLDLTEGEFGTCFPKLFYYNYLSPVWNKLFNRKLLIEHGVRFNPALTNYEDLAFSLDVMAVSKTITVLPDVYYVYKTDFDHDRTVDRIARIDNVAANTDLIAETFFAVTDHCGFDHDSVIQVERIVLQIYLNLFRVKIQTTPIGMIKKQCKDYIESPIFERCQKSKSSLSSSAQTMISRIYNKQVLVLWMQSRYRKVRSRIAKIIKPFLKRVCT